MKKVNLLLILTGIFFSTYASLRADPLITSWVTSISSKYARIYTSTANRTSGTSATTWSGEQTQSSPAYAGVNEVDASSDFVYIRSTGLGAHIMGPWSNPNLPKNQQDLWRFPRTPTVPTTNRTSASASPTTATGMGAIGFMVDGVAAYNTSDGFSYSYSNSEDASPIAGIGSGDGIWNRDAFVNEAISFDYALAHNQPSGEYHYHVNPVATRYLIGDNVLFNTTTKQYSENTTSTTFTHSPILAWMKDGLPLYGPYAYDGGGTGATATANLSSGTIASVTVVSAGTYTSTPLVAFSSGYASATASMKVVTAVVTSAANSSAGGTGYKVGDVLTVAGGSSTISALLTVTAISGTGSGPIATLSVTRAGSYTVVPPNYVSVTGGSGSNAVPTLTWGVAGVNVTNGGTGYSLAPTVTIGGVRRMISGYQLRNGTNGTANLNTINSAVSTTTGRTSLPNWALVSQNRSQLSQASQYGPAVSTTYTLGHYAEDYDYLGDLGYTQGSLANSGGVFFDLNEYNARFCITPDYPNGTWAYFSTISSSGTSLFPYAVGRWYRGNPNTGGGSTTSSTMSSDGATIQVLAGANTAITIGKPSDSGGAVTLTWSSVEGGTYSVADSTNDSTWTSEKTGLTPTNVPKAPATSDSTAATTTSYTPLGLSGTEYARVTLTALATYDSAGQTAAAAQSGTASFLLVSNTVPSVTTGSGSAISSAGATLNGSLNPNGGASTGWFYYGLTNSYGLTTQGTANDNAESYTAWDYDPDSNGGAGFGPATYLEGTGGGLFLSDSSTGGRQIDGNNSFGIYSGTAGTQALCRQILNPGSVGVFTFSARFDVDNATAFSGFNIKSEQGTHFADGQLVAFGMTPSTGNDTIYVYGSGILAMNLGSDLRGQIIDFLLYYDTSQGTFQLGARIRPSTTYTFVSGSLAATGQMATQFGAGNFNSGSTQNLIFDSLLLYTSPGLGGGTSVLPFSVAVSSLTPGTTYHFQAVGMNASGTASGADQTFTTFSNIATLSGLVLSSGTLSPGFASSTTSYTASVTYAVAGLNVTPAASQTNATIIVNGTTVLSNSASGIIALSVGANTITTVVTAQDGVTTQTYTVTVTRLSAVETWRQTYYGTPADTGNAADTADPYATGIENLAAFAFGLNPASASASQLPQPQISGGNFVYEFTQPTDVSGVTYGAQWSATIESDDWAPIADTGSGNLHIFSVPIDSNSKLFLRLTLTEQ